MKLSSLRQACPSPIEDHSARQDRLETLCVSEHEKCLMCGQSNSLGLKLRFRVQPDGSVMAFFLGQDTLQSYPETLHGGVVSSLLDAAMTNVLFSIGVVGVTAELCVRFLAPVAPNRGSVLRASIERDAHPLFYLKAELEQERKLMAHASGKFLVKGCM